MKQKYKAWQGKEYYSPTMLQDYLFNPAMFRRKYIDKTVERDTSIHLCFGTAIHSVVEEIFKKETYRDKKKACSLFMRRFKKECEEVNLLDELQNSDLKQKGQLMIIGFLDNLPAVFPRYLEQELMYEIDGIPILNTVDMIYVEEDQFGEEKWIVEDLKTSKMNYEKPKSYTSFQLRSYAYAVSKAYNVDVDEVRFRVLPKDSAGKVYLITIYLEDNWKEKWERDISMILRGIKAEIFPRKYDNEVVMWDSQYREDWGDIFEQVIVQKL